MTNKQCVVCEKPILDDDSIAFRFADEIPDELKLRASRNGLDQALDFWACGNCVIGAGKSAMLNAVGGRLIQDVARTIRQQRFIEQLFSGVGAN
jgi:hypothetical protein